MKTPSAVGRPCVCAKSANVSSSRSGSGRPRVRARLFWNRSHWRCRVAHIHAPKLPSSASKRSRAAAGTSNSVEATSARASGLADRPSFVCESDGPKRPPAPTMERMHRRPPREDEERATAPVSMKCQHPGVSPSGTSTSSSWARTARETDARRIRAAQGSVSPRGREAGWRSECMQRLPLTGECTAGG